MTKCLITYFYYLTDDYVVCLFCHLSEVYRELLEPSSINRALILHCQFNNRSLGQLVHDFLAKCITEHEAL